MRVPEETLSLMNQVSPKEFHRLYCKKKRDYNDEQIEKRWQDLESGQRMLHGIPEKYYYIDNCRRYNNAIAQGVKKDEIDIGLNITL